MYERKTLADLGIDHIILEDKHIYLDKNNPVAGTGGTCIVYNAWRTHKDSMGNDIKSRIILKEFYPMLVKGVDTRKERTNEKVPRLLQSELYSQQKGEDEYSEYNAKLVRFKSSFDIFSKLYNGSTNGDTVHAYTITEANDTTYIMADYSDAISLSEYMKKDITLYDFIYALMKTAEAVHSLHTFRECTYEGENDNNEGYLHLDITPGNILYHERNRYASIMDTDSFVKKSDLGKAEVTLSQSSGYSAPELFINISEELRKSMINERTDVYSVGAIFYEYVMGEKAENNGEGGRYGYEDILEEMLQKRYRDCPRHAVKLVKEFLRKALSKKQSKRYADMQKTAEALSGMLEWLEPKHVYIRDNYNPNNKKVYGRESKIKLMEEKLAMQGGNGRSRVVCISGIGGIGKSTLAKEYARIHESDYEVITEVNADSAKGAVLQIEIINLKESEELKGYQTTDPLYFTIKKRKLAELMSEHRTLLIVHDYNTEEDDFSTWHELGCDIILTGWHEWKETVVKGIRLKSSDLSGENEFGAAVKIFESGYVSNAVEESDKEWEKRLLSILENEETEVGEITRLLNYHPLSIMLMAKQMASESGAEIHPRKMLEEIEQSGIQRHRGLEIQNEKDGHVRENDAYGHLEWIFGNAVKNGRLNDEEKEILRYMTLVPSESGISIPRFKKWTGLEGEGMLSRMVRKGWLEYNSKGVDFLDNEDERRTIGTYHMPMAISEVLYHQEGMKSTVDNSLGFVSECNKIDIKGMRESHKRWESAKEQVEIVVKHVEKKAHVAYVNCLDKAADMFGETILECVDVEEESDKIVNLLFDMRINLDLKKAIKYREEVLEIQKKVLGEYNAAVADNYLKLGMDNADMGERKKCLEYLEKALKIRKKVLGEYNVDTACTYYFVGSSYWKIGEREKGLKHLEKALKIRKKLWGENNERIAYEYSRLGKYYEEMGERKKGLKYLEKTLEIREKVLGEEHEDTARSYNSVGFCYAKLGEFEIAVKYTEQALEIQRKVLGEMHTDTANSYYNAGFCYAELGEFEIAVKYTEQALEIRRKVLGEMHTDTANSYDSVGFCYAKLGEFEIAVKYAEQAYEIRRGLAWISKKIKERFKNHQL